MKYLLSLILTAGVLVTYGKKISINSKIEHVTVFQKAAQIERTAQVKVPIGKHSVVLSNLSTQINQNSIQLSGDKPMSILSIQFQKNYLKDNNPNGQTKVIQDSIKIIQDIITELNGEKWLLKEEKDLILKNKVLPQQGNNNSTEELIKRASFYRTRLKQILTSEGKVNKSLNAAKGNLNRLRAQLSSAGNQRKYVGEIVLEFESKATQTISLKVSYNVQNAGWHPNYNLRSNSISDPLNLEYNAKVYQRSGVDWNNVSLSLSTANPQSNIRKPNLAPWRLVFVSNTRADKLQNYYSNRKTEFAESDDMEGSSAPLKSGANAIQSPLVNISEQQTAVLFNLKTRYTIPSNNKQQGVTVAKYDLPATYNYYAAPKKQNQAYLMAKTSEWNQYNLISGPSNFFFQNTYVGNSVLDLSGMQDTLDIPLGIDHNILIERKRVKDYCKVYAIGSDKKEEIGIEISVTNNKNKDINLIIEDQIPVSSNQQIEVQLLNAKRATLSPKTGILQWDLELKPGESRTLRFSYSIKFPKDKSINL